MMFQKTYMSRAVTRAMAIDHPIGDPTGGVAFGERNEPISAAISIATMFGTAQAAATGWTLMQGIAFAGAAVSLVGNITGNKTLMQIGAVAGIVGGLGMSGLFGETAKGATLSSLTGSPATVAPPVTGGVVTPTTSPWGGIAEVPAPVPPSAASVTSVPNPNIQLQPLVNAPSSAAFPSLAETNANILKALPGTAAAPSSAIAPLGTATAPIMDYASTGATAAQSGVGSPFVLDSVVRGGGGTSVLPVSEASMYDKMLGYGKETLDFAKTNPTAAMMAGKAVGAVGDWLTGKTDAELEALKAQSSLYGARGEQIKYEIELEKQKRANLNAGYAKVNAGIRVNPNAGIAQPWNQQGPGLINAARAPS